MRPRVSTLAAVVIGFAIVWSGVGLALSGGVSVDGTISIEEPSGPDVEIVTNGGEMDLSGTTSSDTVEVIHDNGEISFTSSGESAATVDTSEINSNYTVVTSISASSNNLTIDPATKRPITVGDGVSSVEFRDPTADDGTVDFRYDAGSTASTTVNGLGGNTTYIAVDADDGSTLDQSTSDASGALTFASLDSGSHNVQIATPEQPSLDEGSASPAGGTTVTTRPVDLSIDVDDGDFTDLQGDTVTVEFRLADDDSVIGSDTLSSSGTANTTFDAPVGGENQWYVVATDEYGESVTSSTFTFNAPDELEIRDEQPPHDLITNSNSEIEFYEQTDDPRIVTREAPNGTINMTGLAADTEFIAVANAPDYTQRRIFIESLLETQTIYLLNESTETANVEFELDDFSGDYGQSNSVLIIERNINGTFTPVNGDFFGGTGRWQATLSTDTRYRLRILNVETGDEQILGQFTPTRDTTQTVTVEPEGSVRVGEQFEQVTADPALGSIPASQTASFGVKIQSGDSQINNWTITMKHSAPNGTVTTLRTRNGTNTGTEEFQLDLTNKSGSVVANVDVETANGTETVTLARSIRENYPAAEGLLGGLINIGNGLNVGSGSGPSGSSSMLAFLVSTLITAGVVSRSGASAEIAGITALGSLSAFAIIGWLTIDILFAAGVAFGATVILRRGI